MNNCLILQGSRKRSKIAEASHKVEQPMNLSLQRTREELESEILLQGDAVRRMKSGKAVKVRCPSVHDMCVCVTRFLFDYVCVAGILSHFHMSLLL